ncbi:MAG: L,D-transpeptidase [Phreatobacter sp.]|nr:L,D-transpeptidase [Phreatobacter sp.]MDP2801469.1 L,D-transpeptidase [Phreatobacter sp.]
MPLSRLTAAVAALCLFGTTFQASAQIAGARRDLGGGFIEFLYNGGQPAGPIAGAHRAGVQHRAAPTSPAHLRASHTVAPDLEPVRPLVPRSAESRLQREAAPRSAPARGIDPRFLPQQVTFQSSHRPGTIVINTAERHLYLVQAGGTAMRYGIGIGRPGFGWSGTKTVTRKAEWPDWRPPAQMLRRRPDLPRFMAGGPANPLGARALYLGSSLYRIHGSNEPWTIGQAVSSGCFRMRNEDVIDLYNRVRVGTRVVVM